MIELLLDAIVSLGSTEVQNVLTSVGESAVKKFRESQAWKKLIVGRKFNSDSGGIKI